MSALQGLVHCAAEGVRLMDTKQRIKHEVDDLSLVCRLGMRCAERMRS